MPSSRVPPGQAVVEGQGIADEIEAAVRDALPDSDVVVHLEPRREGLGLRDRALAAALAEPLVRDVHDIAIYSTADCDSVSLHLKLDPDVPLARPTRWPSGWRPRCAPSPASMTCTPTSSRWSAHSSARDETRARPTRPSDSGSPRWSSSAPATPPRELRLLHTDGGLVVFVSSSPGRDSRCPTAHELASRLEDDIREAQPHMTDVVVHTEP